MAYALPNVVECCQRCCPDTTTTLAGGPPTAFDTLDALRANLIYADGSFAIVVEGASWWHFDSLSEAVDNGTSVLKPDDLTESQAGRWLLFS